MRVGLTFDLREEYLPHGYSKEDVAEFDSARTIEALEAGIRAQECEAIRIGNLRALVERLASGERWDLVFNIAEGMHGFGREAQVPALLDAHHIPYTFSDPLRLCVGLHKGVTKAILRDHGVPTPPFVLVTSPDELADIRLAAHLRYPLFAKPVAEGTGKGISLASRVETPRALRDLCLALLDRFRQPVLVEEFLPGREFTVGILGTGAEARAIGVMEVKMSAKPEARIYDFITKTLDDWEETVTYDIVDDAPARAAAANALRAWQALGCADAGRIDVRLDHQGVAHVMEVNPIAGLNPGYSDLSILSQQRGISHHDLIAFILSEALRRQRVVPDSPVAENLTAARERVLRCLD